MVIAGAWTLEGDGIVRPMLRILFDVEDGHRESELFLVDSGADCTVLTSHLVAKLGFVSSSGGQLIGLGGTSSSATVDAVLTFLTTAGHDIRVRGTYACAPGSDLDLNVLGRDVLAHFDVILSRRRNEVLLIAGNHSYTVTGRVNRRRPAHSPAASAARRIRRSRPPATGPGRSSRPRRSASRSARPGSP